MKKNFKSFFIIFIGALLVAMGTYFFLAPNHIAAGGISGAAIIINSIFPILPIGALMMAMEVILFITGILIIGPVFGGKTIFCSFSVSGIILLLEKFFPNVRPLSNDMLVQLIFGVLICGVGMAIVFDQDASTGGTDIIAKIINKYFKISIGKCVLIADIIITVAASIVFGIDKGMYAILGVILNATLIDTVIRNLNTYKQVAIISNSGEEIKDYIVDTLDRSATIYYAKGAYNNNEREVITTVVNRKQFLKLKDYIKDIDERAFITVNEVNEVLGEGFAEIA
ncbi:YitT family protein [Clostridium aciditolerans]|uniref:YitT family protein n=1 Tax=Clostridium aciditolerans TaxID=339861 RepID=A0A934M796_9CLOT|nr:YitT family protein [Clostridium aciditolerans]MBI6873766.1 YitT family protein [Clostridium aciditolerans]